MNKDADPSTFLTRIVAHKRTELMAAREAMPEHRLERLAADAPAPRPFLEWLDPARLGVIAEVKRASPSRGAIAPDMDAATQASHYVAGGAEAISVLTDRQFYHGSHEDLSAIRAAVPTPLLCKDFILDRYGLLQARASSADLVLLIVAVLGRDVQSLIRETAALGMTPLVEVYTREEVELALEVGVALIGVNNRNLHTFEVSLETTERLAPLLASHAVVASLSGISTAVDARRAVAAGAHVILVGEALVRATDPAALIREFRAISIPAPEVAR